MKRIDVTVPVELPAKGSREFSVILPSPVLDPGDMKALLDLDYNAARASTLKFWSDYVARGAQFEVPEKTVNDLYRTTLWHALRLPRRHPDGNMDLPYSNFAYGQFGNALARQPGRLCGLHALRSARATRHRLGGIGGHLPQ